MCGLARTSDGAAHGATDGRWQRHAESPRKWGTFPVTARGRRRRECRRAMQALAARSSDMTILAARD